MPEPEQDERLTDDLLRELERGDDTMAAMAAELLRRRHRATRDSSTSQQLRKLRWSVETLVRKVEERDGE